MAPVYNSNSTFREREYLFIDGGCLRASVKKICEQIFGNSNAYHPCISAFLSGTYDKIFYYDAVPGKEHNENQAAYETRVQFDHERFENIQALDRVHVALGQIVGKDKRQKGVDVRLTVDMMTHAFRGNIMKATLFAGDSDFVPLIKALVNEGVHVTLWHPPQANKELRGAADSTRMFDFKSLPGCLSVNSRSPAFQLGGYSSGLNKLREIPGLGEIFPSGQFLYTGRFHSDVLKIWRGSLGLGYESYELTAPGIELTHVLKAFDEIYGWDIATLGLDWINA